MRRLFALAVPAALLLGAPVSAPAKGIVGASVCGADGCETIAGASHDLLGGGAPTGPPAKAEPFVRLEVLIGVPGNASPMRLLFLPRSERMLAEDGKTWVVPTALGELRAIARRVQMFPASELATTVSLASEANARAGGPLPDEVVGEAAAPETDGGVGAWWLAVPGAAIALAAGVALTRRRRRRGPSATAVSTGY